MRRYFALAVALLLILTQIHNIIPEPNSKNDKSSAISLLGSGANDPLSTFLIQHMEKDTTTVSPTQTNPTVSATSPAPPAETAVNRGPAAVPVSRQKTADVDSRKSADTSPDSSKQAQMLAYINAARAEANLSPLVLNTKLSAGAGLKSRDMGTNAYFSHNSPIYGQLDDMMDSLGIVYKTAAENIAKNYSVQAAQEAFMDSPGHRGNIMNPDFRQVGLGFYQEGESLYVTQWFTN